MESQNTQSSFNESQIGFDEASFGNQVSRTVKTPNKTIQREDGLIMTPQKRKLDFDFWDNGAPKKASYEDLLEASDLNPGSYTNKCVNLRITLNSGLRKTAKGTSFVNLYGIDKSGEVAIVAFDKQAEQFHAILEVNKIFKITSFVVKHEDERYPSGTGIPFQIFFGGSTVVEALDADIDIPEIPFKFSNLAQIQNAEVKSRVDVFGIIVKDWGLETVKTYVKRDLSLTDESKQTVQFTLWGNAAEHFVGERFSVMAIRKASVGEHDGKKSMNCMVDTLAWVNPTFKEAEDLKVWFDEEVRKMSCC